ncbi:YHS domain-containing (seleno)protein [Flavobacterium cellulosilyticum]|uniref:YHS domain-containing protein n=1 Tax=Flavobacterium cellulosilyticum TaxID=2541731 RepID=A0A4R5CBF2_9FLAO|nr:YHS domain-containing (seleno)protein [Flavobacterium cellulosilyticum]TDD95560.1 YHS domain-containing protein [Flavobacterium cellulosilyticum]
MKNSVIILALLFAVLSFGQNDVKRLTHFNLENKIAIQGYDPVAYFMKKSAIKGKKELNVSYQGIIYLFSSPENKDAFNKNPASFEPQFGGWCAYAMGNSGEKVAIDPDTFKIIDGKLYLFYNAYFNNTLKSWNKDELNLKKKAEANWKKFIN